MHRWVVAQMHSCSRHECDDEPDTVIAATVTFQGEELDAIMAFCLACDEDLHPRMIAEAAMRGEPAPVTLARRPE